MAKLDAYFGLCPIIDHSNLLGVQNDVQPGHVLITLGKNIAIKFKISDQKQLVSWRTKDKFSSPVIYYKDEEMYCAVFSESYIRIWSDNDENLDKHKKLKFNQPIYTIITCGNEAFIVLQNGNVMPLKLALITRKDLNLDSILKENHKIVNVLSYKNESKVFIGLMVEADEGIEFIWTTFGEFHREDDYLSIRLERADGIELSGSALVFLNGEVQILSLWSDGKMFSNALKENSVDNQVGTIDFINCQQQVTMLAISDNYLALYGADSNQEGAAIVIYNLQYKVAQCKQLFKMFTNRSKLWNVESNIYLCIGQNLAVIPYHLQTEQLAGLIGSRISNICDPDLEIVEELTVFDWESQKRVENLEISCPTDKIRDWATQGLSESTMLNELIPEYILQKNLNAIETALDYFVDVSDEIIALLLSFLLNVSNDVFKEKCPKVISKTGCLVPNKRQTLVDNVLKIPISDTAIVPFLRKSLTLDNVMVLLRYICYLLSEEGHSLVEDVARNDKLLIDWGSVLLDANYQVLLLNKHNEQVVETLKYFNDLVVAHLCCLDEFQQVAPIVRDLNSGRLARSKIANSNRKYSIDEITLY